MGDQDRLDLVVAAALRNVEMKAECWQLLTVDEATYHSWKSFGQSQSLLSDSLVANFLLQHYEKTSQALTQCFKCQGPLSQYCIKCNVYMGQPLDSQTSLHTDRAIGASVSLNSYSAAGGVFTTYADTKGALGNLTPIFMSRDNTTESPTFTSVKKTNNKQIATDSTDKEQAFDSSDGEETSNYPDTTSAGANCQQCSKGSAGVNHTTTQDIRSILSSTQDNSKISMLSSTQDKSSGLANTQDKCPSLSGTHDNSKIFSLSHTDTFSGRVNKNTTKPLNTTALTRSPSGDKKDVSDLMRCTIIVTDSSVLSNISGVADGSKETTNEHHRGISTRSRSRSRQDSARGTATSNAQDQVGKHSSSFQSPQHHKRKSELPVGCNLAAKVKVIMDAGGIHQKGEEAETKRKRIKATNKRTEAEGSLNKDTTPRRKHKAIKNVIKPVYPCQDCSEEFHTKCGRDNHLKKHRGDRPYKCPRCSASYARSYQLTSHLNTHAIVKPHICSWCSKGFARLADLKVHEASHSAARPFICDVCGYASKTLSNLTLHKRIHDNSTSKAFVCSRCGEGFRRKFNFQRHVKMHDNIRSFECPHCPMKYVDKGSLKGHVERNHMVNRPRPFVCEICGTARYKRTEFEKHMMIHTGVKPFRCHICGAAFIQANARKGHMKIHNETEGKSNWCILCGAAFKRYSSVKVHMKKVHKQEAEDVEAVVIHLTEDTIVTQSPVQETSVTQSPVQNTSVTQSSVQQVSQ